MRKNTSGQVIGAQMISASDGSAFTGSVTVYVTGDGGTQAVGGVGSGACAHEGNGFHTYAPSQSETNFDHVAFTFTGTGAIPTTIQIYTNHPQTGDAFARLGAPAGASVSADIAAVQSDTDDIQTRLPAALVSGRMDVSVGAMAADVITSSALAASAVTEIQTGLSTLSAADVSGAVWDAATASYGTAGSYGALVETNLDATVSSRSTLTAAQVNAEADAALADVGLTTTVTGRIDAAISTRLASASYAAPLDAAGVRSAVGLASANLDTQLSAIDDFIDTEVGAVKTVTDKLDTAMELDGSVYRFTVNALEQAPVGGGGGSTDWTADERTAIRAVLGIPTSGTTPTDPSAGILDTIRDGVVAVKAKTDNLPSDPADQSLVEAAISAIPAAPSASSVATAVRSELATELGRIDATISSRASQTSVNTIDDFVDTEVGAIKAVTDKLDSAMEADGGVYRFTTNALEQAPGGGSGVTDWTADERTAIRTILGVPTSGTTPEVPSAGALKVIDDLIDTEVSAILAAVDTEVADIRTVTNKLDTAMELDGAVYRFTTNALEQAPSGGGGTSDWTADERTAIRAILGVPTTGTTPADPTTGILDVIRDNAVAIKAKTDNLPSDPADASDVASSFSTVNSTLATISGYIDTEIAAIKAKTDLIPASPAATGDIPSAATVASAVWGASLPGSYSAGQAGYVVGTNLDQTVGSRQATLDGTARNAIADAILARDLGSGTNAGTAQERTVRSALRFVRNKWSISSGTLTVTREDDSTTAWTAPVTTNASAEPITGIDPT